MLYSRAGAGAALKLLFEADTELKLLFEAEVRKIVCNHKTGIHQI
jgi:hypothetical protein